MNERRRGPRGDVSAEGLLRAAEQILRTDGLSGLTLRAVTRQADVTPNTLYTYFEDMTDLRNRLGDRFLGGLDLDLLQAGEPREAFSSFITHLLEVFHTAPGQVELLATQRIAGPHALALSEALLDFFVARAGYSPERAAAVMIFATEWLHGHLLLSESDHPSDQFTAALTDLDLAAYPRTAAMLGGVPETTGIDLLVDTLFPRSSIG